MRKFLVCLNLIGLILTIDQAAAGTGNGFDVPVKVTEVKEIGLSDRDESKSVIEVRWQIDQLQRAKISSFKLALSATYADGTVITERRSIDKNALSARVEIPSVKTFRSRPPAFIKNLKATVTAVISEK
ncbi:MAG: hypothetical protein R2747_20910 [Pyrinomonadaceae bacterium]